MNYHRNYGQRIPDRGPSYKTYKCDYCGVGYDNQGSLDNHKYMCSTR